MNLSSKAILRRLGDGESIAAVCATASISRREFDTWWQQEAASRVPTLKGSRHVGVRRPVNIVRNHWGNPTILADHDEDLFFGLGYAMAQDRLFQLDFLRRKGSGRLSEILGPDGRELDYLWRLVGLRNVLEWDLLVRTVGIRRIAEFEWTGLPEETRTVLRAFSAGINALIEQCREHPDCFLYDSQWEPARRLEEVIAVKGGPPVRKTIRFSRNGPVVDEVLPPTARQTGPVSLKWLGAYRGGGWLTALLGMDRAKSASEFRVAMRPWFVPTFAVVFADAAGHIGFHAAGAVPIRDTWERGYRPGWDPRQQWEGLIPFEGMPQLADPQRGWIATANNRPAPEDFPYPLSGTWSNGLRAERIRQLIESKERLAREDFVVLQHDTLSLRACRCLPHLLKVLKSSSRPLLVEAVRHLETWDCRIEVDRVGATLFDVFFAQWTKAVVRQRFEGEAAALLVDGASGLAAALLTEDTAGWFPSGQREPAILAAMESTLSWLSERLGADMVEWGWGRLHVLPLRHFLSGRGDLGELLDGGSRSVGGDYTTVCNFAPDALFAARTGAGYRLLVELSTTPSGLWAVDAQGQSGHPGSSHYGDQLKDWIEGRYHFLPLDSLAAMQMVVNHQILEPMG